MRTDRRGFFRTLGAALAFLSIAPGSARSRTSALQIHRATRNTLLGAVGPRWPRLKRAPARFKPYPGASRVGLPEPVSQPALSLAEAVRSYAPADAFRRGTLSLGELGRLLYFTNGVTGELRYGSETLHLRAAPSAGALYSGEVYVVAEGVRGLGAGLYYYAVREHQLVRLRSGSLLGEVARALERPGAIENAAAVVLLTNVFPRYTWRYANRGYRYGLIDSGHIGENLRLAAFSAGLSESAPLRFHDDLLNALLGVEGRDEAVCALHAVGRRASSAPPPRPVRRLVEKQRASGAARSEGGSAIARYHEATKLVPAPADAPRTPSLPPPDSADDAEVVLPRSEPPPLASVEEAIRVRRSAERFLPEPVSLEALGFALEMARGHRALQRAEEVDLYLVVHRASGLEPGLYRYHSRQHRLAALRRRDLRGVMKRSCRGQGKAASAAVGLLMVGRLTRATARGGERSYRDLLVESGAIGQRIYLAAEASGLAARNLAAFVDDDLNEIAGLDGSREAVIHLTMLGPGN